MRAMALDLGDVRVGVAVSDPSGRVALPHSVLDAKEVRGMGQAFINMVAAIAPDVIVVGLPLSLNGCEGRQVQKIRSQAGQIAKALGIPLEFEDERFSSEEASHRLQEAGLSERERRGRVDEVAASIFLQTWLDAHVR